MSEQKNYYDIVGAYMDNELEGEALRDFKDEIATNPALRKELEFQKQLIDGIKENRRLELKTRLDKILVSGGAGTMTIVKIVSGVVILAGIGYGVFTFLGMDESSTLAPETIPEIVEPGPDAIQPASEEEQGQNLTGEDAGSVKKETEITHFQDITEDNAMEKLNTEAIITPDVPEPIDEFDTDTISEDDIEVPSKNLGTMEYPDESNLEISIINTRRKYNFHYQVKTGQLILYGNFDEEPYQLLEINAGTDKHLYLYFKGKYYEINKKTEEISPLLEITNRTLISALNKLKDQNTDK